MIDLVLEPRLTIISELGKQSGFLPALSLNLPMSTDVQISMIKKVNQHEQNAQQHRQIARQFERLAKYEPIGLNEHRFLMQQLAKQVVYNCNILENIKKNDPGKHLFLTSLSQKRDAVREKQANGFRSAYAGFIGTNNNVRNDNIDIIIDRPSDEDSGFGKKTLADTYVFLDSKAWEILTDCVNQHSEEQKSRIMHTMLSEDSEWKGVFAVGASNTLTNAFLMQSHNQEYKEFSPTVDPTLFDFLSRRVGMMDIVLQPDGTIKTRDFKLKQDFLKAFLSAVQTLCSSGDKMAQSMKQEYNYSKKIFCNFNDFF